MLLRTRFAFLWVALFAIAIVGKLTYIQVLQAEYWTKEAETVRLVHRRIKAPRGNIYASDGSLLATSLPFYQVALDPCVVDETVFQRDIAALSIKLAALYQDRSPEAYQALIRHARQAKRRYLAFPRKWINYQEKKTMCQWPIFCHGRWQGGVLFERKEKRFRPFKELAARTVGFVNADKYGVGLEYSFNNTLQGIDGRAPYQKTAGGHWKMIYDGTNGRPVRGDDIETTIDINLQDVAHTSLLKVLQASDAMYGCTVVMEVTTGEIKAMVNLSRTAASQYKECYNYAIGNQGTTEPGSTFKLVSMLAFLEETSAALTDTIDAGDGRFQFYDRTLKDVKAGGFGKLTLQEVFEYSSNIGMARLIDQTFGYQPEKFVSYVHKLGLAKPLDLPIVGMGVPLIKHPNTPTWSGVTLPWMSIGYELKITPLHTLMVYNAVANNGKLVQPVLVKRIKQANRTIQEFRGCILHKKICSDATLYKLQTMLAGVVTRGTARRFKHGFYQIAGKTGTANKVLDGKYTNHTYASFVGYFPAEAPRYSCIVVVDSPQRYAWHFGANVATVVKDIADKIAAKDLVAQVCVAQKANKKSDVFPLIRAGYRKDLLSLCNALQIPYSSEIPTANWLKSTLNDNKIVWATHQVAQVDKMPPVLGMTLKDALFLLENYGLQVSIQGQKSGRVIQQSLPAHTKCGRGTHVTLTMSA